MKIGLFFGSFNPIHIGHLLIANYILNEEKVRKIWFVVSPQNPLKDKASLLNAELRLKLVKQAVSKDERFFACDIEFKLSLPSFTTDSLKYIKANYPNNEFVLIMGSDSFNNIVNWKDYKNLLIENEILIYRRSHRAVSQELTSNILLLNNPVLDISSTSIRELLKAGKCVKYLVPDSILEAITQNGYYR